MPAAPTNEQGNGVGAAVAVPRRSVRISSSSHSQQQDVKPRASRPAKQDKAKKQVKKKALSGTEKGGNEETETDKPNDDYDKLNEEQNTIQENGEGQEAVGPNVEGGTKDKEQEQDTVDDQQASSAKKIKLGMSKGDTIPDHIKLKNQLDEEVDITSVFNGRGGVIFVYPKASTPGCTNQACAFRDHVAELSDLDFQVFGLSMDSPKALKSWHDKHGLSFPLFSDPKQQLIKVLGASKSSSQVQRSHFILGKGGVLLHSQSPAVAKESANQAIEFIKSLPK